MKLGVKAKDRVTGISGVIVKLENPRVRAQVLAGVRFGASEAVLRRAIREHVVVTLRTEGGHFLRVDSERLDIDEDKAE